MGLKATVQSNKPSAELGSGFVEIIDGNNPNSPIRKKSGKYTCQVVSNTYNFHHDDGSVVSFRVGDSAWVKANIFNNITNGVLNQIDPTNYLKLKGLNVFVNFDRFTDDTGGQVYANNYMIDHHTGIGWYLILQANKNWDNTITDNLGTSFGGNNSTLGFTDWFTAIIPQYLSIFDFAQGQKLNYPPVNLTPVMPLWSGTTRIGATFIKYLPAPSDGQRLNQNQAFSNPSLFCRKHF